MTSLSNEPLIPSDTALLSSYSASGVFSIDPLEDSAPENEISLHNLKFDLTGDEDVEIRKQYLQNFAQLCLDFFTHQSPVSEVLVGMVEFSSYQPNSKDLKVNWIIYDQYQLANPGRAICKTEIEESLLKLGISNGKWLYSKDHETALKVKRKVREKWHYHKALQLDTQLTDFISTLLPNASTPFLFQTLTSMQLYLNEFTTHLGAAPFLRGLKELLHEKFKKPNTNWLWCLENDHLTQAGPEFLEKSVKLLIDLNITPNPNIKLGAGIRAWQINSALTHIALISLLIQLNRSISDLGPGKPGGEIRPENEEYSGGFNWFSLMTAVRRLAHVLYLPLAHVLVSLVRIQLWLF